MTETFGRTVEIAATLAASDSLVITLAAALPARLDRVKVNHNTAIQQFGRIAERMGLALRQRDTGTQSVPVLPKPYGTEMSTSTT